MHHTLLLAVTKLGSQSIIAVSLVIKTSGLCQAQPGGFLHVNKSSLWCFDTSKKITGAPYIEPSHAPASPVSALQYLQSAISSPGCENLSLWPCKISDLAVAQTRKQYRITGESFRATLYFLACI